MATSISQSRSFPLPNTSTQNNPTSTRQVPGTKPAPVDLPALQNASRVLIDQLEKDAQIIPDLGETLTASGSQATSSYSIYPDDIRVPFQKRKFVGIPDGLFQYYETVNVTSHMGLMPEIERVWISIDHKLFLWDYNDGQEIASFTDQPDVITGVALVKPKTGLFIDDITYLLVICTPISVLLIGVALANQITPDGKSRRDIKLYATDLTISTDIEMTSVAGSSDGRIFMCGQQDGNLYELHYQQNESWFGKRIQLINHSVGRGHSLLPKFAAGSTDERIISVVSDVKRNCFYTLSATNVITMYAPAGDKGISRIQTLPSLYKSAQEKAPGSPALTPKSFQVVDIHVVDPSESRMGIQLIAITTNGVRLYFAPSLSYDYSYGSSSSSGGIRQISMVHVRLPPMNLIHPDEQEKVHRPAPTAYGIPQPPKPSTTGGYTVSYLDNTCYANGLVVATQAGDVDGTDYILCLAPDLTRIGNIGQLNLPPQQQQQPQFNSYQYNVGNNPNRRPLTEYATVLTIPGRTWAMASVPKDTISTPTGTPAPSGINELASQFGEYPNQFMLLTNVGLTFLVKRRALDYLRAVLEELHSEGNVQPIIEFRDSFGRDQTCSMLLGLACGSTFLDPSGTSTAGTINTVSPEIAAVAKQAFYDFGERPIWTERVMYGTTAENKGSAIYSGRREGFALYFARLVRPFWKKKITVANSSGVQVLNASETLLLNVQKNLYALKEFLTRNPHLFHSSPSEPTSSRAVVTEQEAWKAEQNSVSELQVLLTRTIEALSFVLLLNDYRFGELISKCDADVQKLIFDQSFEGLITTQHGMTISRALVNVVIDQQIGQQISVDTISEVLQQRCGSFCSTDDVMLYKAKENIRKAAETRNPNERQKCLTEALRLFSKGAKILEFEKLREIIGDFQQLNYAKGAVILPLTCAQVQDADNVGLECWYAGMIAGDTRRPLAEQRLLCYDLILDSLTVFEDKCSKQNSESTGGHPVDDHETVRSHAYELAFASEDEMFHSTLYDWLIQRNLADDLLEMRPAYLEAHLKREPATVQKFQLLWKFYVKNGQPLRAAEVLGALAESTQFELHLDSRLECLTLAVANAKSHPISVGGRHETAIAFLTDLEEKLDVAQVQLEIYNTLLPHIDDAPEIGNRIKSLSNQLFTMTELYEKFAIPFDLPAIKLLCLHVSEHRDDNIVKPIWHQIFDEIMNETDDPVERADLIMARVIPLGQRFYPSESSFPTRYIANLLIKFLLVNKEVLPMGWAARILRQCNVRFAEIWELFHEMYESQVPPFNDQANVQAISGEFAILITDWVTEATRPQANVLRAEFPVGRVDAAIDQYLSELEPARTETKALYEEAKRQLRRYW
ncbi:putative nucleoporin [Psilocybe cubensis]|uniref:Nucleoporin n=2 Tax=Psilocybe cubensis TaxID=181762 RepID=A0A8H7YB71_PSICU|nr:putative nucleoporin [Psilocybe cubensis]KAH9487013.1 putative nucleoporin [Psilocybe cubensis]